MMKKIAYITERDINDRPTGATTRDIILLKILKQLGEVSLYYSDMGKHYKYEYLRNNRHIPSVLSEINNKKYDIVIISAYQTSPYLISYKKIIHRKIFYFCDSCYLMLKNTEFFNIKYKLVSFILSRKEYGIIKHEQCAYLGNDEINSLPKKYRKNAVVFPFHIAVKQENYFDKNGHVLYMGQFSYWTNREAFYKILRIAPRITGKIKIFGLNIPKINTVPSNVELVGYVESLDDAYIGAKALIYPISCGTGIKNKVIEAMSYGIPVVGFRNAFTNMNVEHNRNCIIVRKTAEIIDGLNRADLGIISENARLFIEREMSEEHALSCVKKYI
jgi:glycosyltransferase involved in cell wall biosynthesis